jgi:hypothetical protein
LKIIFCFITCYKKEPVSFYLLNNLTQTKKTKMKKKLLLFASLLSFGASAQMSVPNGNFENWTSATYDFPQYYPQNSNPEAFFRCNTPFNVTKSTDSYNGSFAVQLQTNASATDTCYGYFGNFDMANGDPSTWTGGAPITQKPTGIRGYYKYNVASADSALIIVVARQGGVTIGSIIAKLGGIHSTYTLFNFNFSPALPAIPDSIIFASASSDAIAGQGIPGSTLLLDSVSFTGITVQPLQMNGDFEMWQSQTIENPDFWYGGNSQGGLIKTTDRVAGNFAVELQTSPGDNNGVPRAQAGYASTGYWDESCMCQKGGYPFSNMVDTLAFWYKYVPSVASDSAEIYMNFKNGGTYMGFAGMHLPASPTYQYKEIPVNLMSTPDSVIIGLQSSLWQDSALIYVGADLKVDEMHFKSQPLATGLSNAFRNSGVSFYPNPFNTTGTITIDASVNTTDMEVVLYNIAGSIVKKIRSNEHTVVIDRTNLDNGIYFYELRNSSGTIKKGKVVIE